MEDVRGKIGQLEERIERLAETAARCRKIAVVAKIGIGAGLALLAAILLGIVMADGLSIMLTGILTLGGIVLFGSNDTTLKQAIESIAEAERERAELIGDMNLTLVPEPSRLLH